MDAVLNGVTKLGYKARGTEYAAVTAMATQRVLCINTSGNPEAQYLAERRNQYHPPGDTLSGGNAVRSQLVNVLLQGVYGALAFAAHGGPSVVYGADGKPLLAPSMNDLRPIAKGRTLYLFACEAGSGGLPRALLDAGAKLVAAFTSKPEWTNVSEESRWGEFDEAMVRALGDGASAADLRAVRNRYLSPSYPSMSSVLGAMVIAAR